MELALPGISNDSCLFVVTGQNKIPLIKTVRISNIKGEYVCLTSSSIDDSQGNNNHLADFGETFFLNLSIRNLGLTGATGLYAKISTTSDLINVNSDSVYIGTMNAKSGITLSDAFEITVSDDVPDMALAIVTLKLKDSRTEKQYSIDIRIHAPELSISACVLDDSAEGNGNSIADPGETFDMIFKVTNQGSSSTSGQFYVTSHSPDLSILEPDVKSGELKLGETTEIPVRVKLSESTQTGTFLSLTSLLDCNPYILNRDFTFRAGKIRESFESSSFTIFPWVNISPVPWIISGSDPYDGIVSAQSGRITHNQSTSLIIRATYAKEDSLKFVYRVSSELDYDNLIFSLNDKVIFKESGEKPWTRLAIAVPAGINKMEWKYVKDQSVSAGEDAAWIDMIDFAGTSAVDYIEKDLQVARIVAPVQKNKFGKETVSVKVLNLGREPVNEFNLGYYVNDMGTLVTQTFNNAIMPFGDSVTVSFKTKADLSRYGNYDLVAYSFDNSDDYLANDTLTVHLENHHLNDSVTVYPNPYYDNFSLFIQTSDEDKLYISVVNNAGSTVYMTQKYVTAGMNTIEFSDLRLSPGIYYLKVKGIYIARTIVIINLKK